jgi:hypothetical protein
VFVVRLLLLWNSLCISFELSELGGIGCLLLFDLSFVSFPFIVRLLIVGFTNLYAIILMLYMCHSEEAFIIVLADFLGFFGELRLGALTHVV